ncbi:MAG: non-homologous end-joining DNA ligase [Gammaproteobacteria bacterium]|uniref:non-homologous end-joining DNA ligase n=1 Tax=Oceanibaculum nanhaiense TaxID=1909734 RepID=UPI0032EECBEF
MAAAAKSDSARVRVSRPGKLLYPDDGLDKRAVTAYYRRIAPYALPHCAGRPLTLRRFPDGIASTGFYHKHAPDAAPAWMTRVRVPLVDGSMTQLVADDADSLVWLADYGALELHLALAPAAHPHRPDRIVFDLDPPGDGRGAFAAVQDAARAVRALARELGLVSAVQTSGSRGLHVVWPILPHHDYDRVHAFARDCAALLARREPGRLTAAQRKDARGDRVFLDYLRNSPGQTAIAPYSLRALPGAPIATPLDWREALAADMHAQRYHLRNIFRRLGQRDCPWQDIAATARELAPARDALARLEALT